MSRERVDGSFSVRETRIEGQTVADTLMAKSPVFRARETGWGLWKKTVEGLPIPPTSNLHFEEVVEVLVNDSRDHVLAVGRWGNERILFRDDQELMRGEFQTVTFPSRNNDFTHVLVTTREGEGENSLYLIDVSTKDPLVGEAGVNCKQLLKGCSYIGLEQIEASSNYWIKTETDNRRSLYFLKGDEAKPIFVDAEKTEVTFVDPVRKNKLVAGIYENGVKIAVVDPTSGEIVQLSEVEGDFTPGSFVFLLRDLPANIIWFACNMTDAISVFQNDKLLAEGLREIYRHYTRDDNENLLLGRKKDKGVVITLNGEVLFEDDNMEFARGAIASDSSSKRIVAGLTDTEKKKHLFCIDGSSWGLLNQAYDEIERVEILVDYIRADVVMGGEKVSLQIRGNQIDQELEVTEEVAA